jgi:Zn-dependent peptidase ImmA (M78 family)/DNA-binding XRE family transcriptional regulator
MQNIFPRRLKNARLMRGLSMDKLCSKMQNKVSKTAIMRYEKGEMMPNSSVMISLSNALNVKVDYFFRPFAASLDKIEFRKKARLKSNKAIFAIKEKIRDKVERYIEIENILSITTNFFTDFSNICVHSDDDIYLLSKRLRKEWELGEDSIVNVVELLEEHAVKVIEIDVNSNFDGLSVFVENTIPVIVLNKNFEHERKRFTALHELAHILINFDSSLPNKEIEKLCNLFASEMLLPKEVFMHLIGNSRHNISLRELKSIQAQFGISVRALMYKAKELNIITENRYNFFCISINKDDRLKREIDKSTANEEYSSRFERLVYRALASDIITLSKAAVLLDTDINTIRDGLDLL